MKSSEIRNLFLNFFKNSGHEIIEGSSLIPIYDNSLLFTNAGMNQFKNIFLGNENSKFFSVTTAQRCIRAGGKHNDLSNVGFTARHLTSFEMLGNFSFGNYFKKEAIKYAWDFLTKEIKLNSDNLWVTVYKDDNEAYEIWKNLIKIDEKKIIKLDEKDNFWQIGDVGPCGPCSEIYFDLGIKEEIDKSAKPGDDFSTRFIEIWNLVFMQYDKQKNGELINLKKTGIDTGMGLERLSMIMQNVETVFDTDLFSDIFLAIENLTDFSYQKNKDLRPAFKVIADHLRTSCFIINEGLAPSNEGRGYVLRKIIRRALLFLKKLTNNSILWKIAFDFLNDEKCFYFDLKKNKELISKVIEEEEKKFKNSLNLGYKKFNEIILNLNQDSKIFSGSDAFLLYDTFGFPLEVTEVLANEKNLKLDYKEYEKLIDEQRERSRLNDNFEDLKIENLNFKNEFIGYDKLNHLSNVKKIIKNESNQILFFDKVVFYSEMGGQCSDFGKLKGKDLIIDILGIKKFDNSAIGIIINSDYEIKIDDEIEQIIDFEKRHSISANHSATHLLNSILMKKFGESAKQAGSKITDKSFTFDCEIKDNLTEKEIFEIENLLNKYINSSLNVITENMTYEDAIKKGARALFTEKYDKGNVRVVSIGEIDIALCGGTHVKKTSEIENFFIKNVESISSGIKRFECYTKSEAINQISNIKKKLNICCDYLKVSSNEIEIGIEKQKKLIEDLKNKNKNLNLELINANVKILEKEIKNNGSFNYNFFDFTNSSLSEFTIDFLNKISNINNGMFFVLNKKGENFELIGEVSRNLNFSLKNDFFEFFKNLNFKGKINEKFIQGIFIDKNFSKDKLEEEFNIFSKKFKK